MATTNSGTFIPELWSGKIIDTFKDALVFPHLPKRSKGAQLLRDAALGHPEYKEHYYDEMDHTADASKYLANAIDADILTSLRGSG